MTTGGEPEEAPARMVFLPGAGGRRDFWAPVSAVLRGEREHVLLGWPGSGGNPPDPAIDGLDGLLGLVLEQLDRPAWLVAQSMGGVLAVRAALARPGQVRGLVLVATSGGVDMRALGGEDWRPEYVAEFPDVPPWFVEEREDLTERIPSIASPVLLLFGDADAVAPPTVGAHLQGLLPHARLEIVAGGDHGFAHDRPAEVAAYIGAFVRD